MRKTGLTLVALLADSSRRRGAGAHDTVASLSPMAARVIVKLKADSPLLRQDGFAVPERAGDAPRRRRRLGLATRAAWRVRAHAGDPRRRVTSTNSRGVSRARATSNTRPDSAGASTRPNDPLYADGVRGAARRGQWYLRARPRGGVVAGHRAAWAVTTGSPGVVVAVLDTGVRFDHRTCSRCGRRQSAAGYDM